MSLSQTKATFGIHSITAYNPNTFEPYGTAKVLGSLSLSLSGENIALNGGSQPFAWDVQTGLVSTEGSILLREMPTWLTEAFMGNALTANAAEADGYVSELVNVSGTSLDESTTGVASLAVTTDSESDVKTGMYVMKAVTSTTVDIYAMSDVDFGRGTALSFVDDSLKITETPLTIATDTEVEIPSLGITITGGSGTIALEVGDTAYFDARAINAGSDEGTIGKSTQNFVDVGIFCTGQKMGDGAVTAIDIFRAKGSGIPFTFTEKAYMESEIPFTCFYDSERDGIFRYLRANQS